jgi:hypothetical protein
VEQALALLLDQYGEVLICHINKLQWRHRWEEEVGRVICSITFGLNRFNTVDQINEHVCNTFQDLYVAQQISSFARQGQDLKSLHDKATAILNKRVSCIELHRILSLGYMAISNKFCSMLTKRFD